MIRPTIIEAGEVRVYGLSDGTFYIGDMKGGNVCVDTSDQKGMYVSFNTIQEAQALITERAKHVPN